MDIERSKVLLELFDPFEYLCVRLSLQVLVVPACVPGVARVESDRPEAAQGNVGAHLVHVIQEDVVKILVMSP